MKERLTGAIILVALIVLLVPELLTGPIRSAPQAAAMARATGEPPLRSYTINLADERQGRSGSAQPSGPPQPAPLAPASPSATAAPTETTPPESTPPAAPARPSAPPVTPAPQPAPSAARPAAVATPRPATPAAPPGGRSGAGAWVVQLGSFASHTNAEALAQQVRAQGFTVSVSQASSGRRLYRVRVGPVRDRAAASVLARRLSASGHTGSIVPK